MGWILQIESQVRLACLEMPENQIPAGTAGNYCVWISNRSTNNFSLMALTPCFAKIDLFFIVVVIVKLNDTFASRKDSLVCPKDLRYPTTIIEINGAEAGSLIEIPNFQCLTAYGQKKLMVRIKTTGRDFKKLNFSFLSPSLSRVCAFGI